jgi:superfamily II DNA or RNA helicase
VVHTKELFNQWVDRVESFLGIPKDEVGIIGSGKKSIGDKITVALVQSLYKCAEEVSQHIGFLIVDECHRTPSRTFTGTVTAFDSKYMLGLSATPWRRDKLSRLIFWHIGDVHHEVDKADLIENGDILKAEVITRETDFRPYHDAAEEYTKMLSELTEDRERNLLIASDVASEKNNGGGISLVLSDRKAHCEALQALLQNRFNISSELLTGDIPTKQRQDIVKRLNKGKVKVLIATGQLIGEGFDCKGLSTLFMATPIKFNGRVIQYLGRVLRPAPGKSKAKVYDYIDTNVGVLKASAKSRQKVYEGSFER